MANSKRKCRYCKDRVNEFIVLNGAAFCNMEHAVEYSRKNIEKGRKKLVEAKKKEFNKEQRKAKAKVKTRSEWLREAQKEFNKYIRIRDILFYAKQGKPPECISCGTTNPNIQYAAGHFKTVGAHPELRFDEKNVYLQCNKRCNCELSGNIHGTNNTHGYIDGLKKRFGIEEAKNILDYLNSYKEPNELSIDEIINIKKKYYKLAKQAEEEYSYYK